MVSFYPQQTLKPGKLSLTGLGMGNASERVLAGSLKNMARQFFDSRQGQVARGKRKPH